MPSFIRLQNPDGDDVVRINLSTGTVEVLNQEQMPQAAAEFWKTIAWLRHSYQGYRDIIIRGSNDARNTIISVLEGGERGRAGDVVFQTGAGGFSSGVEIKDIDTDSIEVEVDSPHGGSIVFVPPKEPVSPDTEKLKT